MNLHICRRTFLASAGLSFISGLSIPVQTVLAQRQELFASACKVVGDGYKVVLFNDRGQLIQYIDLPDRGHDITFDPISNRAVAFARRPGNFAVVFAINDDQPPITIFADQDRHFFGHGKFSPDGKLLYATENDFKNTMGKIGIYDSTNNFQRIGEFESYGIGPHQLLISPDGKMLIVANGGIETHPDFGRAKLNLATMQPSLVFIDRSDGSLLEKHQLPTKLHQLSIRHMSVQPNGRVIFGGQYQGKKTDLPPLIGDCRLGEEIKLWSVTTKDRAMLRNYIGSVVISNSGEEVAVSSPKGGVMTILSTDNHRVIKHIPFNGVCGLAASNNGFIASSSMGEVGILSPKYDQYGQLRQKHKYQNLFFDNHIMAGLHS